VSSPLSPIHDFPLAGIAMWGPREEGRMAASAEASVGAAKIEVHDQRPLLDASRFAGRDSERQEQTTSGESVGAPKNSSPTPLNG